MASRFIFLSFAFIFLVFCGVENGSISHAISGVKGTQNRKLLSRGSVRYGVLGNGGGAKMAESEWEREMMRWVPSGPDPLHHNGAYPKKPRSP